MATYYWVGGDGTWDTSTTTNWALTSGGTGGAGVPTITDNVIFDDNSAIGTVSVVGNSATCYDLIVTRTSLMYITGVLNRWAGSISTPATGSVDMINLSLTSDNSVTPAITRTVALNKQISDLTLGSRTNSTANASVYELTSNFNVAYSVQLYQVTLTTNNYAVNCGGLQFYSQYGSTINAGTSTITFSKNLAIYSIYSPPVDVINGSAATFNILGSNNPSITVGASSTFGTININPSVSTQTITLTNLSTSSPVVVGNLTMTQTSGGSTYVKVDITNSFTITGAFTCNGPSTNQRYLLRGLSTPTTVSAGSTPSMANVDFYGITATGTASWSGTSIGDAGNNSGITFTAPKTVYRVTTYQDWVEYSNPTWANTSGGTADFAYTPLPQDTAIIDNNSATTPATLKTMWGGTPPLLCTIDATSRTLGLVFGTNPCLLSGTIITSSSVTIYDGLSITVLYGGTISGPTITPVNLHIYSNSTYTVSFPSSVSTINMYGGTISLAANLTTGSIINNSAGTTLAFGTSKIIVTGVTPSGVDLGGFTFIFGNYVHSATGTPVVDIAYAGSSNFTQVSSHPETTEANSITFNISATGGQYIERIAGVVRSLNFASGYTGNLNVLPTRIYGSLKLSSSMTITTGQQITLYGSSAGNTIDTAGLTLSNNINLYGNGTGVYSLVGNFSTANGYGLYIDSGTFNTNNYTISLGTGSISGGSATLSGTLNLGSSTVTCSSINMFNTLFTVNAGTSNITVLSAASFGSPTTLYNLTANFTNASGSSGSYTNLVACNNFTINNSSGTLPTLVYLTSINVSGTLTITGTSSYPVTVMPSATDLTPPTITAAVVSLAYVDFSRVTAAGTATWTGTAIADGGGNTGITFTQIPRTLYWVGGTGTMSTTNASNWALSSGGAGGQPAPRVCDSCIVDANSGTGTISGSNTQRMGNLTFTGYTGTFNPSTMQFWGNLTYTSGMTLTANQVHIFVGYNCTVTMAGKSAGGLQTGLAAPFGTLTLADNFTATNQFRLVSGTLNTNGKTFTCATFSAIGTTIKVLNLGSSTINLTNGINMPSSVTNLTINPGTSDIRLTATTTSCSIDGRNFNKITYAAAAGGGTLTINGTGNTIGELASTVTNAHTVKFLGGSTNTIGKWSINGTAGQLTTVTSTTTTPFTIVSSTGVKSADYLNLSYSTASPANTWYAGVNSTNGGNNTNWTFTEPPLATANSLFFGSNF